MTTSPAPVCTKCQKPLRSSFRIEHVAAGGGTIAKVELCSIVCVLSWAYAYMQLLGTMGAMRARGAVTSAIDAIKSLLPGRDDG